MKCAFIAYHKNAATIYDKKWLEEYKYSVLNQTYKEFEIFELNYGGDDFRIFENSNFHSKQFPTFVHGLNYLLDCLFFMGYDCVANSNCDDTYSLNRIEKQIEYIEDGYDVVANNFALVEDGQIFHKHYFDKLDIATELSNNHNIISHPSIMYSKLFWTKNRYVPEQQPMEDLMLWQRAIKNSKFVILPDFLLYHRLHTNSVCQSDNK